MILINILPSEVMRNLAALDGSTEPLILKIKCLFLLVWSPSETSNCTTCWLTGEFSSIVA